MASVLIEYLIPPDAEFTPELLLSRMSVQEAYLMRQMPDLLNTWALLLNKCRELENRVALLESWQILEPPARVRRNTAPRKKRKRGTGEAIERVRAALVEDPSLSLSRLSIRTGLSRSYVCELRRRLRQTALEE